MRLIVVALLFLLAAPGWAQTLPAELPYASRVYTSPDGALAILCVDERLGGSVEGQPAGNPESRKGRAVLFRNNASKEILWELDIHVGEVFWEGETIPNKRVSGYQPRDGVSYAAYTYARGGLGIVSADGSRFVVVRRSYTLVETGDGNATNFHPSSALQYEVSIYRRGDLFRVISDPYFVLHEEYRKKWDAAITTDPEGDLDDWVYLGKDTLLLRATHSNGTVEEWKIDLNEGALVANDKTPASGFRRVVNWAERSAPTMVAALAGLSILFLSCGVVLLRYARRRASSTQPASGRP